MTITQLSFVECLIGLLLIIVLIIPILCIVSIRFRFYFKLALYGACLVVSATIGALISIPYGRTPKNHFRMFRLFHYSTFWMGLRMDLRNMHYTVSEKPYVLIANHQSALDVLTMSYAWPDNCVVLLKSSLRFLPGFNLCTILANSIYVNRFNKQDAHKSLLQVTDVINRFSRKVWIFPEGTRSPDGRMLPFKKGAFIVARQAKIPIVPVVFSSYNNFYDLAEYKFDYGGHVIIEALPPIDTAAFDEIEDLMNECHRRMEEASERINNEICTSLKSSDSSTKTKFVDNVDKNTTNNG